MGSTYDLQRAAAVQAVHKFKTMTDPEYRDAKNPPNARLDQALSKFVPLPAV